jgi:membrane-bound ClpP family serine protease
VLRLERGRKPAILSIDSAAGELAAARRVVAAMAAAQARGRWLSAFVAGDGLGPAAMVALAADDLSLRPDARFGCGNPFGASRPAVSDAEYLRRVGDRQREWQAAAARARRDHYRVGTLVTGHMMLTGRDAVGFGVANGTARSLSDVERRIPWARR